MTGYDYEYLPGGPPTGGMVSLLWHAARGPVLAGSMDPYRQNEPNNMQMPRWQFDICTTPRIELRRDGKTYCSSNDLTAALTVGKNKTSAGGPPADPAAGVRHTRPLPPPVQPCEWFLIGSADPARRASIHCYSENRR